MLSDALTVAVSLGEAFDAQPKAEAPAAESLTFKELQNGDAACNGLLTRASGEEVYFVTAVRGEP